MTSLLPNTSGRLAPLCMLGYLAPLLLLLQIGACWGQLDRNRSEDRGSSTTAGQGVLKSSTERVRGVLSPVEEAIEEQGYYLRRLFLQYGENETLSFGGLQRLLGSLGLGEVSVLEISHEGLGHDHVLHLDMLEVQENKHVHSHPPHEHAGNPPQETERRDPPAAPPLRDTASTQPPEPPRMKPGQGPDPVRVWSRAGSTAVHPGIPGDLQGRSGEGGFENLFVFDHPVENHLHENCLNMSQLLVNFGLDEAETITPALFTFLCPALLYQIDSRVCIRHRDELEVTSLEKRVSFLWALLWSSVALTVISVPSLLALSLVPLLTSSSFRSLLSFLVALAVGTLCGDALLHLLPHAQQGSHEEGQAGSGVEDSVLKGLCVLGGAYLLFTIESMMGLRRHKGQGERGRQASEQEPAHSHQQGELDLKLLERRGQQEADWLSGAPLDQEGGSAGGPLRREGSLGCRTAETTPHSHSHSHSHSVQGLKDAGIGSVAWMVIMGDGMHNFTDGLAIGAAFSQGVVGGLSTSVAVFCHELPHELGDFAVLLQAGLPLCRVLLVSLLSAVLGFLGMLVGVGVSQQSREVTPWIFSLTAGMFIYVALVDMLPEMLRGESSSQGKPKRLLLQHLGLLLGGALMLCIAVFEDKIILNVDF
ncbi:zinc transporter ZIP10 [Acipenser oxyrinchus oxyrinchus]|uniref:Zinc transporter ZIP10 n=1 Tax=Acipenser oxyrinchus oxyrinchus TaxID=40147 RepID=A0AAD8CKC2_ACIOX|nr:zinc transporter ZIP10 [Acipenser oxyrinchus oxyrinchus]